MSSCFLTIRRSCQCIFVVMKTVSGKRPKHQQKRILDHSFSFTIQNVASGYILCHLENWFFQLYLCFFKIVSWKSVVSPINSEAVVRRCSSKQVFLKTSRIFLKTSLILLKRDSSTGVFCEICEIFKNTFFTEHLRWLLP